MTYSKILLSFLLLLGFVGSAIGQNPPINFRRLTVASGLNDGHVQMIGQDKFGFMWFGTYGALNRYDGRNIKTYSYRSGDSTTPLSVMAISMVTDSAGRLFFGFFNGLAEFDYRKNQFRRIDTLKDYVVFRMIAVEKDWIYCTTQRGLVRFNPLSNQVDFLYKNASLLQISSGDMTLHNGKLHICTEKGLRVYEVATGKTTRLPPSIIDNLDLSGVIFDSQNRMWVTTLAKPKILRFEADFSSYTIYDRFLTDLDQTVSANYFITKDKQNRLWFNTKQNGILQYLPQKDSIVRYMADETKPWTPNSNIHLSIFCDKEGTIWVGGTEGVNYCHPDRNLFQTILPFDKELGVRSRRLARSATEDEDKNLWFGTVDGVSRYNPTTKTYREWRNEPNKPPVILLNSIRHIYCDSRNNVWIPTSKGMMRYNRKTDHIDILTEKDGFPPLSYMRMYKDRLGNLWVSAREGYFVFDEKAKILRGGGGYPEMQRFAGLEGWSFLHDSKNRYWFGFNEGGLGMFDPATHKTYHWQSEGKNAIAGTIVMDIQEDKNGVIWISTNYGVTEIEVEKNKFKTYNSEKLGSNTVNPLAIDALNRVWMGTSKGLVMLDSSRQSFTNFGFQDGLPSLAFTEFSSYTAPNGDIIMATQKGYIRFNPLNYAKEKLKLDCYIASIASARDAQDLPPLPAKVKMRVIFEADENAMTFNLVALNYFNPTQTWFAYKLEGFEDDWHITQDPKAVYTNLASGKYTLHYKVSLDRNDWDVEEKIFNMELKAFFYKTGWFWALIIAAISGLVYWFYRNRQAQRDNLADLQRKAQMLEKEKAIMQYEGLKQQLNPHFLFNSLTSLSSLIHIDTKIANEFLESLSKTYRYILKSSESETVLLSDEIKFAENYVKLQKTRFEEGLFVNINVSEAALHHKIVPVTLQNLIENAMKHNIIDAESPLNIDIFSENDKNVIARNEATEGAFSLIIRNNLQKKNFVATSNKQGLSNLINLYHYLSNTPVEITETAEFFTVKIPLL